MGSERPNPNPNPNPLRNMEEQFGLLTVQGNENAASAAVQPQVPGTIGFISNSEKETAEGALVAWEESNEFESKGDLVRNIELEKNCSGEFATENPSEGVMQNLPCDIIAHILSLLPIKSLLQFKCVSKPWRFLISDPHFAKMHLNQNNCCKESVICLSSSQSLYTLEYKEESSDNVAVALELTFPGESPKDWFSILGSCNGLLLISDGVDTCFLVNPSTREIKELPKSPFGESNSGDHFIIYGIGCDCSTYGFKVVRIFCDSQRIVSVFTLEKGWRRVENSPYDHWVSAHLPGVHLNGALHWSICGRVGSGNKSTIASLNLIDDTFNDVPPPSFLDHFAGHKLSVLAGCLSILVFPDFSHCNICVMTEYGVRESWTTQFSIAIPPNLIKPLCFPKKGDIMWEDGEKLVLYNPSEEKFRDLVICDIPVFCQRQIYEESILSPNYDNKGSIKMEGDGSFFLKNLGKSSISVNE